VKIRFSEPKDPSLLYGMKVPYAPAKRRARVWRWRFLLFAAATPVLYFAALHLLEIAFVSAPGFVSFKTVELHAPGNGSVKRILIAPGSVVRAGQQAIQLDNAVLDAERTAIAAQISAAGPVGGRADNVILAAQEEESVAAQALNGAQNEATKIAQLFRSGAATTGELDASRDNVLAKEARVREIRVGVQREISSRETIDVRVKTAQLRAQRESVMAELRQLQVTSPIDGAVISIDVVPGEEATPDRRLALIRSSQRPLVRAYLSPKNESYAAVGRDATVVFATGQRLRARVAKISYKAQTVQHSMLPGFVSESQGIEIMLQFVGTPPQWLTQVDGLPVTVRFNRFGGVMEQLDRIATSRAISLPEAMLQQLARPRLGYTTISKRV